jgi:hypothetical protein
MKSIEEKDKEIAQQQTHLDGLIKSVYDKDKEIIQLRQDLCILSLIFATLTIFFYYAEDNVKKAVEKNSGEEIQVLRQSLHESEEIK